MESENKNVKKSSIKNTKVFDINKKVDKILFENYEKLNKPFKNELDLEKISLKNKKGNTIYYLRKRSKDKDEINNSKILSKKIINDDKKNQYKK